MCVYIQSLCDGDGENKCMSKMGRTDCCYFVGGEGGSTNDEREMIKGGRGAKQNTNFVQVGS